MKKEGTPSVCAVCGGAYYSPPSHRAKRRACSRACRAKMQSEWQRKDLAQRFWQKVDKSGDCWVWTGALLKTGYGSIRIDKKAMRAHRVAYELCVGPIPDGMLLRHSCDNPPCVNPSHLLPGNAKENVTDAIERGRHLLGEDHPGAKLANASIANIRRDIASGMSGISIARAYGVSDSLISKIKHGKKRLHD